MNMIIGIDFDNTIIDYHSLFYEAGISLGILLDDATKSKQSIRRDLLDADLEDEWVKIQGLVYGKLIKKARMMEGFYSFLKGCQEYGWVVYIISHKTPYSADGRGYDLHLPALSWLKTNGIFKSVQGVFFETTRRRKISRINHLDCRIIIDDLPEVLLHPDLHSDIIRILYDPDSSYPKNQAYQTRNHWNQILNSILELKDSYHD